MRKEKSWKMMRELKRLIRENRGQWNDSEELRKEERNKIEVEKELEREKLGLSWAKLITKLAS